MKKNVFGLLIIVLVFLFQMNVFAIENQNVSEPSGLNDELKMGVVTLSVDVSKNRLKDFKGYDFYVEIKRTDVESFDPMGDNYYVNASDNYQTAHAIPYGEYTILSAGVPGDGTGKFSLSSNIESFTISKENPSVEISFEFTNIDYSTGREFEEEDKVFLQGNNTTDNSKLDSIEFVKLVGIFMVLVTVVIGFCIFFLISMRKIKKEN